MGLYGRSADGCSSASSTESRFSNIFTAQSEAKGENICKGLPIKLSDEFGNMGSRGARESCIAAATPEWRRYNINYFGTPSDDDLIVRMGAKNKLSESSAASTADTDTVCSNAPYFGRATSSGNSTPTENAAYMGSQRLGSHISDDEGTYSFAVGERSSSDVASPKLGLAKESVAEVEAPASRSSSSSSSEREAVERKSSGRSEQEGSKTLAITPESSQSSQSGAKVSRNSSKASAFGFGGLWSRKSSGRSSTTTRSTSSTRSGDPTSSAEAWSASLDEYLQPHAVADATKPRARKARSTGATTRISGAFSYGKRLLPSFRRVQVEAA